MMDKDLLRLVIVAIGACVVLGIIILHFTKKKNKRSNIDFYDKGNPLDNIDQSLVLNTENDDFDVVSFSSTDDSQESSMVFEDSIFSEEPSEPSSKPYQLPSIIQFSLVATADEGFSGQALVDALNNVGLVYGSMKVFERLDDQRRVDYAVASMVEPGTFPDTDFELFNCPGIVFFLQPSELDEPLAIFDDFIQTINLLAVELDGVKWDHERQPLSDETIQKFRMALS